MRKNTKWSLLVYLAEILLLIAAITAVIRLVPDLREKRPGRGDAPAATESSAAESSAAESKAAESEAAPESEPAEEPKEAPESEPAGVPKEKAPSRRDSSDDFAAEPGGAAGEAGGKEETETPYEPPTLVIASDLHYMSPTMTDFGEILDEYLEFSDGRVVPYLDELTDAFLEEVMTQKPSALILSGDISQDGEKVNHGELARKLRRVQAAGIPVLVIPGNHDINNPGAATYYGDAVVPTESVDADGFYDIYHEFGYDKAADRDENSLSYLYKLDEKYWLMMLDTCVYFPENEVGGRIRRDTLGWMEEWLKKAEEEQATVIPVGHHNLLKESALYTEECTLENSREVIKLLEKYRLPLYISGHLHLQRVKKNVNGPSLEEQYGIHEIVSASLAISPCQYGILKWSEDGSPDYHTKSVDVPAWAVRHQKDDENLLDFAGYGRKVLTEVISTRMYRSVFSIPADRRQDMADLYADLNSAYCGGTRIDPVEIKSERTYFYWKRYLGGTEWFDRLSAILKDTGRDHNRLRLEAGVDFPARGREDEEKTE